MSKILWLSHVMPWPPNSGVLLRSYNLIKEVSKHHDVVVLAFNQKTFCPDEGSVQRAVDELSKFCRVHEVIDIPSDGNVYQKMKLLCKGLLPKRTYTVSWLESEHYQKSLNRILSDESFDLIHADTISLAPYINDLNIPCTIGHHNIESAMMSRRAEHERNWLKKLYFIQEAYKLEAYERKICDNVSLNVTCSSLDSDRLKAICPEAKTESIPNGVDTRYFTPIKKDFKHKSLIFAGRLSWYPNEDAIQHFVDDIWLPLSNNIPGIEMTIVGKHPPNWLLKAAKKDSGLRVTGFVEDVRESLSSCNIYVCPIRDGGGTKLKVLDALAMEMPLVADPIACEGIDVTNETNVLFASTPQEYVEQIQRLLENRDFRDSIARNGRKLVEEKYDFIEIGKHLSLCFKKLA